MSTTATLHRVFRRELQSVRDEIGAFANEEDIWRLADGISNSSGTLALHLAGNLQHFLGAELGGTGYVRDRDAEFSLRGVPRARVFSELDAAEKAIDAAFAAIRDADLGRPFPSPNLGISATMGEFLHHLAAHLAYHLGQMDYHRRLTTGQRGEVRTLILSALVKVETA